MTLEQMRAKIDAFLVLGKHWLSKRAQWTPIENKVEGGEREGESGLRLRLFTDRHQYTLVMYPEHDGKKSYLGCVEEDRSPLPGEMRTRSGDLAAGEFNDETLRRIAADILSKELHEVADHPDVLLIV